MLLRSTVGALGLLGILFPPQKQEPVPQVRYVRIELSGEKRVLSLAEVQVVRNGRNLARSGAATQSSIDFEGAPARAIDGNWDCAEHFPLCAWVANKYWYGFDILGEHEVSATYENGADPTDGAAKAWRGSLESNAVRVVVRAPAREEEAGLVALAKGKDALQAGKAARLLRINHSRQAVLCLAELATDSPHEAVRKEARRALRENPRTEVADKILEIIAAEPSQLYRFAVPLVAMRDSRIRQPLIEAGSRRQKSRYFMTYCHLLGEYGDPSALPLLKRERGPQYEKLDPREAPSAPTEVRVITRSIKMIEAYSSPNRLERLLDWICNCGDYTMEWAALRLIQHSDDAFKPTLRQAADRLKGTRNRFGRCLILYALSRAGGKLDEDEMKTIRSPALASLKRKVEATTTHSHGRKEER